MTQFELRFVGSATEEQRVFSLKAEPDATVLDILETLRARQGGLVPAYRHSCHHGSCGSCGALINGKAVLMCLTRLAEIISEPLDRQHASLPVLEIAALPGFTVIAGIAVHPGKLFGDFPAGLDYLLSQTDKPELLPDPTRAAGIPKIRRRFEQCIECGICRAVCPVDADFIGPAALAAINRQLQKSATLTNGVRQHWLGLAGRPDGVAACRRHLACSRFCPQAVYPGKHIQLLRNQLPNR